MAQGAITVGIHRQQHQVAGLVAVGQPRLRRHSNGQGQAKDGLDVGRTAGPVKGNRPIEDIGVGQGQVSHLFGRGPFYQFL